MNKILMYSDLHVRPERMEDMALVLDQVASIAKDHGVDLIINGGDTFHTRGIIKTSCFDLLVRKYREWYDAGLKQFILVGNHDQEDRAGEIHPFRMFGSFDGWRVIDEPVLIPEHKMALFPYMKHDAINEFFSDAQDMSGWDAWVHWGIKGAKRNDWNTDTDGVPLDHIKDFRRVFSGHYHFRSQFENVQYIGSPLQQNHSEAGQDKGVLIYDRRKKKVEFVEIKGTPKHYDVSVEFDSDGSRVIDKPDGITARDIVRVRVKGDAESCFQIGRDSAERIAGSKSVTVEREVREKHYSRLNIETDEIHSTSALVEKYVQFVNTELDRDKLLSFGMEILDGGL